MVSTGRATQAEVEDCLARQILSGYGACPRTADDLESQHEKGTNQVEEGISKIQSGAITTATSIPGTSITGPVPTSGADLVGSGVVTIIINGASQ